MQEEVAEHLVKKLVECSPILDEAGELAQAIEKEDEREAFRAALSRAWVEGVHKLILRICHEYPRLSPWPRILPGTAEAQAASFDTTSPWHIRVYESYRIGCNACDSELTYDDAKVGDLQENVLQFSVALAAHAQELGWQHMKKFTFLCPRCAAKRVGG